LLRYTFFKNENHGISSDQVVELTVIKNPEEKLLGV